MALRTRRTAYYIALVAVTTAVFTVAYNVGMATWEGRPQPLYRSLEVVVQSFTTTGYGEDAPWQSPGMNALAIVMQLAGIGLILTAADVFAVPWLQGVLSPSAPETVTDLDGHVVVCEHTPRTDVLIDELDARDRAYVLIESDPEHARELHESGYRVIRGDPESVEVLGNARLGAASAVVADAADDVNASIALSVREVSTDVRVVSLVEDASLARYHRLAGADTVLSPRQLLGRSLAGEVPTAVTTTIEDGVSIGDDFQLAEVAIAEGSPLAGRTLAEARLRERFGATVVGVWSGSSFTTGVDRDHRLEAGTQLLVAGRTGRLDALREATAATVSELDPRRVVIAGYGDTGRAAHEALADTNATVTVLEVEGGDRVDITGDARDPDALTAAGIEQASVMVLAIEDDTEAIFATLVARDLNPDLRIVVRSSEQEDVQKLYRAGADYVQSLATVSGRMLASRVFEDEDLLAYDRQVSVVRLPAPGLAGRTLADAAVGEGTGCAVVAVLRDGDPITEFDPESFEFQPDDDVVIAGDEEGITEFERRYST